MTLLRRMRAGTAAASLLLLLACGGGGNEGLGDSAQLKTNNGSGGDVPGVSEPVEIVRDKHGVSHIYAKNERDLFYAQGFNAARDRLWQLDLWRRKGEGKMAEQFGARFLPADTAARKFLFRGDLEEEYASYHPAGKEIITAFADGINAYIDQIETNPSLLPMEFQLTGTTPGRWSATSSLIRIYGITRNVGDEVAMARRIAALGLETTQEWSAQTPERPIQVPAGTDVSSITNAILAEYNLAREGLAFEATDFPAAP